MAGVVSFALGKLADVLALLEEKYRELQAVRRQIEHIQRELLLIQALLTDADSKRDKKELVTAWLNQVREIANNIATVIDTFRDKIEENHAESSNWFRKIKMKITTDVRRNYKTYMLDLPGKLEGITQDLNWIYKGGIDLGIQDKLGALDDVDDSEPSDVVDDPEVVGFEDDKGTIIEQLLDRKISRRTVLSIVGTGGLGKTTMAKKVYKSAKLEGQFHCRAWLTIFQRYNLSDLLREILYSVDPRMKKENPPITDKELPVKLKSSLRGKRYLIILDDVWDIKLWEQLKMALPDMYNASRVIITTRSLDVAKAADCNTKPYKLRYLSDAEGLALLFKNAFQQHVQPEDYPHDLLDVANRLTKKCGGLPLALVVLGGILTRRDRNYTAWNTLDETMDWSSEDGEKCMKIIARSYDELPDHLKPCFLYFASFPEDHKISGEHVTRMWMAEGFIPKDGVGTIEHRAEKFLEELVQRCLIQVTKKSWNSYCKYCSMHDLLRDLAICKAKENDFFTVFSKEGEDVNQLAVRKPRRATLQCCTITKDGVYSENTGSLLCFGFDKSSSDNFGFGKLNYSGFRLLRVLTLESIDMREFPQTQWPKNLIHLRYMGLRSCYIPQDIFKKFSFDNLETIDLKGSYVSTFGEKIDMCDVVLPTLRHVYGDGSFYLPLEWDQHTNLQTIKDVPMKIELVVELGCCINLRTLAIGFDDLQEKGRTLIKEWENLKGVLRRTEQLVYLGIERVSLVGILPFRGTTDLPCHGKIQKLYLRGELERNIWIEMFPTNLTKLKLNFSKLKEDPMPILERLQSLRILSFGHDSYVGTELICSTGGFPKLEKLKVKHMTNLCHWDIKEGAMPSLCNLIIRNCLRLSIFPELQMVRTLQELLLVGLLLREEDLHKIEHIPSVHIERQDWF